MLLIGVVAMAVAQNPAWGSLEQGRRAADAEVVEAQEMLVQIEKRLAGVKNGPPAAVAEFRGRVSVERASLEKIRATLEALNQAEARRDAGLPSEAEVATAIEARELLFRVRSRLMILVDTVSPVAAPTAAELLAKGDELFKKLESALADSKRKCGQRSPFADELAVEKRSFEKIRVGLDGDSDARREAEGALYAQLNRLKSLIDSAGACSSP